MQAKYYAIKKPYRAFSFIFALVGLGFSVTALAKQEIVRIYNWSDYIAENTLKDFTQASGIKPIYETYESNEELESKLLRWQTGYDVVVPTNNFLAKHIKAGLLQKLDKKLLPNWKNLDLSLLQRLEDIDPDNQYAVPYLWGSNGIIYNFEKIQALFGSNINSWSALFDPKNVQKLSRCGVAILDSPDEMFPAVLTWLGLNPNSMERADYKKAEQQLLSITPFVSYETATTIQEGIINDRLCAAVIFSGDAHQAINTTKESGKNTTWIYAIPKEGSEIWLDMLTITHDAKNPKAAHAFINYLLEPEVIANISDYTSYANGNLAAQSFMQANVLNNPDIYPPQSLFSKLYIRTELPRTIVRQLEISWKRLKLERQKYNIDKPIER